MPQAPPSPFAKLVVLAYPVLLPLRATCAIFRLLLRLLSSGGKAQAPSHPSGARRGEGDTVTEEEDGDEADAATAARPMAGGGGGKKKKPKEEIYTHPRLLCTLKGFSEPIASAELSQDGTMAAAIAADRTLRVYSGLQQAGAQPLPSPLLANVPLDSGTALSFSANARNIIIATEGTRRVLAYTVTPPNNKVKAGLTLKREFPDKGAAHAGRIGAALLAPNSKYILTAGADTDLSLKLWSLNGDLLASTTNKQLAQHGATISAECARLWLRRTGSDSGRWRGSRTRAVSAALFSRV